MAQPLSIRVLNVQMARTDTDLQEGWRVIVDEADHDVLIDGAVHRVRVLHSWASFSATFEAGGRRVNVGGGIQLLEGLALRRVDDLSLVRVRDA
jgi:hypothetical protein